MSWKERERYRLIARNILRLQLEEDDRVEYDQEKNWDINKYGMTWKIVAFR